MASYTAVIFFKLLILLLFIKWRPVTTQLFLYYKESAACHNGKKDGWCLNKFDESSLKIFMQKKKSENLQNSQELSIPGREGQASGGMLSERIMGEPSCNSCCSDSRSAGVMR